MPTSICNCVNCNISITDPDFRVVLIQEEFPEIEIGPYCEECLTRIKICSGCQKPVMGDTTTHNGKGEHFCMECAADLDICSHCGTTTSIEVLSGKKICASCKSDLYFKCPICNEYHEHRNGIYKNDLKGLQRAGIFRKYGPKVCESCYEAKKGYFKEYFISECQNCGLKYSLKGGSHKHYCDLCYSSFRTCGICGEKHPVVNEHIVNNVLTFICDPCTRKFKHCDGCHQYYTGYTHILKGKSKTYKVCDKCKSSKVCFNCYNLTTDPSGMCRDCMRVYKDNICEICGRIKDPSGSCRVCTCKEIYNYSTKPKLFFNALPDDPSTSIFFGFENEVSFGSESDFMRGAIRRLYEAYDPTKVLAKSDGSIQGSGYEIVTQPMTLMFFHQFDLGPMFSVKMKKNKGCGLHIHVSRESFSSDVHLFKVCNFLHADKKFTEFIAGRKANSYCAPFMGKVSKELKESKRNNSARHQAINLSNKSTVEFRLFDGCTTETELRNKVETLHALISYMRSVSIKDSKNVQDFINFVNNNKKFYPNASSFLSNYNAM